MQAKINKGNTTGARIRDRINAAKHLPRDRNQVPIGLPILCEDRGNNKHSEIKWGTEDVGKRKSTKCRHQKYGFHAVLYQTEKSGKQDRCQGAAGLLIQPHFKLRQGVGETKLGTLFSW